MLVRLLVLVFESMPSYNDQTEDDKGFSSIVAAAKARWSISPQMQLFSSTLVALLFEAITVMPIPKVEVNLFPTMRLGIRAAVVRHLVAKLGVVKQPFNAAQEFGRVSPLRDEPGSSVLNNLAWPASIGNNNGNPRSHGL
jgi:hypothetical protein